MRADAGYCYRKNDQIIYKDLADGPALIDPYRRALIKLNPTAQAIWQLLDGKRPVAAIVEILGSEFEVDAKSLEKDVADFLKDLSRREIIK
jgi:coenzyme PQQ biosynthesis protein PqqD